MIQFWTFSFSSSIDIFHMIIKIDNRVKKIKKNVPKEKHLNK